MLELDEENLRVYCYCDGWCGVEWDDVGIVGDVGIFFFWGIDV